MTEWFEFSFDGLSPAQQRRLPKWARRAAWHEGQIYLPAIVAGNEVMVFLCMGYDATPALLYRQHLFCPADWLAREFPDAAEACEKAGKKVRALIEKESDSAMGRPPQVRR